jgi:hypothetical protein
LSEIVTAATNWRAVAVTVSRLRAFVVPALAAALAFAVVASATAADIAVVPTGPVSVRLVPKGKLRSGDVTLLLRNDGATLVQLHYFFLGGPDGRLLPLAGSTPRSLPAKTPVLVALGAPPPSLRPNLLKPLRLRLAVAGSAVQEAPKATLVLEAVAPKKTAWLTVDMTGVLAGLPDPGKQAPQPAKASIATTSWLPFWQGYTYNTSTDVRLPARVVDVVPGTIGTRATSTAGDSLQATLMVDGTEAATGGFAGGRVDVSGIPSDGTFDGAFVLGPTATDSLPVSVHVRDLIIWPLVFVLLGAFVGGYGTRLWELRRRRDVLRKAVKEIVVRYHAPVDEPVETPRPPRSWWKRLLDEHWFEVEEAEPEPELRRPRVVIETPRLEPFALYELTELDDDGLNALYGAIAEARETFEFDALTEKVLRLDAAVATWSAVRHWAHALGQTLPALHNDDLRRPFEDDTLGVLDAVQDPPADDRAAAALVGNLQRQLRILHEFLVDWVLFAYPRPLPANADPPRSTPARRTGRRMGRSWPLRSCASSPGR